MAGVRRVLPSQESGTEFSGVKPQQNTLQPRPHWNDLSPAEQAQLIKTTGQDTDPAAIARTRNFLGQMGEKPADPPPPRYPRR